MFGCVLCASLCVCVRGVRMIQSAISLCEDSLHKHTRHAEDVVILRLIVCVSDVSNHHGTRGGFTLPLSLSFSAFLLRSYKLSHRPSAPALSHLLYRSPLKRFDLKGLKADDRNTDVQCKE